MVAILYQPQWINMLSNDYAPQSSAHEEMMAIYEETMSIYVFLYQLNQWFTVYDDGRSHGIATRQLIGCYF